MSLSRRGFTIVEALAAFAIVALSLGVLIQGVGQLSRGEASADVLLLAKSLAENHLARLQNELPLQRGNRSGAYNAEFNWKENIDYWSESEARFDGIQAYRIVLEVQRASSGQLVARLETVRLSVMDQAR